MKAEIYMMRQIQRGRPIHENVLRMYGYVVDAPPYILVLVNKYTGRDSVTLSYQVLK